MSVSERIRKEVLDKLVNDVNRRMKKLSAGRVVNGHAGLTPRFELYHCSLSLCSHKVRAVLAEKGEPYTSHAMSIMPAGNLIPQNYRPEYVRLRLLGQERPHFVSGYTGVSSVEQEGFDPCVVPTLVDHKEGRIVIDSKRICEYIDENADQGEALIPAELKDAVEEQLVLVDRAPHVALLYGAHPKEDRRPAGLAGNIKGVHARKIRCLRGLLEHIGSNEPDLRAAYEAKIAKESAAGAFMLNDAQMIAAHQQGQAHVRDLEAQLEKSGGPWVCGDRYTMADIVWTVSLYRLQWLGNEQFWGAETGLTLVPEYYTRASERPSFRAGVRDWKYSHGPSPYVPEMATGGAKFAFLMHTLRETSLKEAIFGSDIRLPKQ
ncbi:MAG: glutathione S-transferase family protein [Pseudomonadota bacterium]